MPQDTEENTGAANADAKRPVQRRVMSNFTTELPTLDGFYLVKNDNFELAAELVTYDGEKRWMTTEGGNLYHDEFADGTEYKRCHFS